MVISILRLVSNFNSIKVQLKPAAGVNPYAAFSSLFQFHKGTIKAVDYQGNNIFEK